MALTYAQKLKDPRWQRKRLEVFQRDGFCCSICMDGDSTLHVHHKHYKSKHEPWDYELHELVTVCETCHDEAHQMTDELKMVTAYFDFDGPWSIGNLTSLAAGFRDRAEVVRGRPSILHEKAGVSPVHYVAGEVAAEMADPSIDQWKGHISRLMEFSEILKEKGAAWVFLAVKAAIQNEEGRGRAE